MIYIHWLIFLKVIKMVYVHRLMMMILIATPIIIAAGKPKKVMSAIKRRFTKSHTHTPSEKPVIITYSESTDLKVNNISSDESTSKTELSCGLNGWDAFQAVLALDRNLSSGELD